MGLRNVGLQTVAPHGVEHCKIAALHANYEHNPMITADIYTTILDIAFI